MKKTLLSALVVVSTLIPAAVRGQDMVAPNVGHHITPLEFQDLDGVTHRLNWSDSRSRAYVIYFFEPRCSDCFREFVFFDTLCRLAQGLPLDVFAIEGSGQEPGEVENAISGFIRVFQKPAFGVVPDPSYRLSKFLNVQRIPTTILMESHGVVVGRNEGFDDLQAIDLTRKAERLLGVEKGRFSPALAVLNINRQEEVSYEKALEARQRAEDSGSAYAKLLPVGSKVPQFEFADIAGRGGAWIPDKPGRKATVVFFWGALCQPCIREMTYLEQLFSTSGVAGLEVIGVEANGLPVDRVTVVMERYRRFNPMPSFPVVADPERLLCRLFGVSSALPQTFVIGKDATVLDHTDQFIQGSEWALADKIERALELAPGSLTASTVPDAAAGPAPEEAPTVVKSVSAKEDEFTACLVQAESLYRNWQYSAAIPHFMRCLEIDPEAVVVRERLAEIYQRQGELEKALGEWETVFRLDPGHLQAKEKAENLRKSLGLSGSKQP